MRNDVCVLASAISLREVKSNCNATWISIGVRVGYLRKTGRGGEANRNGNRRGVEMWGAGEGSGLVRGREDALEKLAFGMRWSCQTDPQG